MTTYKCLNNVLMSLVSISHIKVLLTSVVRILFLGEVNISMYSLRFTIIVVFGE